MARKLIGKVTSNVTDKTFSVKVDRRVSHPIYRKQYTVSKKYQAHDPKNEALVGDTVEIVETRPISKTKHWQLVRIVQRPESLEESK
jgi:small subunit ribosomal protein S17